MRTYFLFYLLATMIVPAACGAAAHADSRPTLQVGDVKLWLDRNRGYSFAGAALAGRHAAPTAEAPFPVFAFVDMQGKRVTFDGADRRVTSKLETVSPTALVVHYEFPGAKLDVCWEASTETIACRTTVIEEGELRVESVGSPHFIAFDLDEEDYAITPDSFLLRPGTSGEPNGVEVQALGNQGRLNFAGARVRDRIVYLKPLTYSNVLRVRAVRNGSSERAELGVSLYFRPRGFQNPATSLIHRELAWRMESAGDVNFDGDVDWVDAGVAYRNRYIRANPDKNRQVRDSFRFFHTAFADDTYAKLVETIEGIDFAEGLFYVKGALVTNVDEPKIELIPTEHHPYNVQRSALGNKTAFLDRIRRSGHRVGIYYGGEYLYLKSGDWPDELVKKDPEGKPAVIMGARISKDYVRALATGKLKEHWRKVFDVAQVGPGDPVYLDGYNSHSDFSYDPNYPTTPQSELEARRALSHWFKYDRRVMIAGEGLIEGTIDIDDYALNQYGLYVGDDHTYFWKSEFPRKYVPLFTVVYTGSVYCGDTWYELRMGSPNWAAAITLCAGLWDWDSLHYPDHLYEKAARTFFNNNIFWAQIADRRIADLERNGNAYTIRFEEGCDGRPAVLFSDPEKRQFWLEVNGVRYDGFTPFSTKGVMAILKQGDFDITLPLRDDLEILPTQPHKEKLGIEILKTPEGFTRVKGNFSKLPWKLPILTGEGPTEKITLVDVDPVLMLIRKPISGR